MYWGCLKSIRSKRLGEGELLFDNLLYDFVKKAERFLEKSMRLEETNKA